MENNCTKDELTTLIGETCGCAKKEAGDCLNAVLDNITKTLAKGDKVTLTGFGTFSVSNRKARMGVNPRTGEKISIAATKVPKFKAGKSLKDAVK